MSAVHSSASLSPFKLSGPNYAHLLLPTNGLNIPKHEVLEVYVNIVPIHHDFKDPKMRVLKDSRLTFESQFPNISNISDCNTTVLCGSRYRCRCRGCCRIRCSLDLLHASFVPCPFRLLIYLMLPDLSSPLVQFNNHYTKSNEAQSQLVVRSL